MPDGIDLLELKTFWSPEPILALKQYYKLRNKEGMVRSSVGTDHIIGASDFEDAICIINQYPRPGPHPAHPDGEPVPALYHNIIPKPLCGFYGVAEIQMDQRLCFNCKGDEDGKLYHRNIFLVEFAGRVIEHEKGWRAGKQRIIRQLEDSELHIIVSKVNDQGEERQWISASLSELSK